MSTTVATSATSVSTTSSVDGLPGFETTEILIDEDSFSVAVADTPELRSHGLMGVVDLGSLDGMVFLFPEPVTSRFWMKDTLIPLDIAFFSTDGALVGVTTMEPCTADPCPTYGVDQPSQWAIEVPAGVFADLPAGARLDVGRDPFLPLIKGDY